MCNTFKITLNDPWFDYVKDGTKIYEGRCNWKKSKEYKIGDLIIIEHHIDKDRESYIVEIIDIHHFKTFEEALFLLPIEKILPNVKTIEEGIEIYKKYYKLETQIQYGVILIEIKIIN